MGKAIVFSGLQIDEPLQKVTLLQSGLINPTLSISSNNEETDTTFSFTISAKNAIKVCYMVKESSEAAPSDIFSDGQSITISELPKKITVSGKFPETTYKIYAGAISSDNVKVEKNISITTKEKVLVTADDYVEEYKKLATSISAEQENALKVLVGNLISEGLWEKIEHCFPLLGGISGYKYDLKDVRNQKEWAMPDSTTWDYTRNSLFTNLPGKSIGTPLEFTDIKDSACSIILSVKKKEPTNPCILTIPKCSYEDFGDMIDFRLSDSNGGYRKPYMFGVMEAPTENVADSTYRVDVGSNNNYAVTYGSSSVKIYCGSENNELQFANETSNSPSNKYLGVLLGGYYDGEKVAPSARTFCGNFNFLVVCSIELSLSEINKVVSEIHTFNEVCGRNKNYE